MLLARDRVVRAIRQLGHQNWKQQVGYYQRNLVETAMYRLKTLFGSQLRNRIFEYQVTEAFIQ